MRFIPKYLGLLLLLLPVAAATPPAAQAQTGDLPPETAPSRDEEHEARVKSIEMAHAFTDEGYIVRDGFWRTRLAPNEEAICRLQLFAGVDYWICLGSGTPEAQLQMGLFTSAPRPVAVLERVQEPARAAIRVRPLRSGTFYLKVRCIRGQAARVCVTYCYK